jgi:hypothetical protein
MNDDHYFPHDITVGSSQVAGLVSNLWRRWVDGINLTRRMLGRTALENAVGNPLVTY